MSLVLKFRWSEVNGEGNMNATDAAHIREEDWVVAADFLRDVIHDAQNLYDEVLEKKARWSENGPDALNV